VFAVPALAGLLGVLLLALTWQIGSAGALLTLAYICIICVPGLPIGFKLFGRTHPAGWISGALMGYASSASAFWAAIRAGAGTPVWLVATWILLAAMAWAVADGAPLVELPRWTRRDGVALAVTLLLVPAILWRPFTRIGEQDATGARRYRAYFTADLLWHAALTEELARFQTPPRNPYSARQELHYYWTHFVPPAIATSVMRVPALTALRVTAIVIAITFVAMLYVFAWSIVPRAGPIALATCLVLLASSGEGLYELWRLHGDGLPLQLVRYVNIDAVTLWRFGALTFDGLIRGLWYNPQHSLACALGMVALTSLAAPVRHRFSAALLGGVALGLAAPISPFPASLCAVAYGVSTAWGAWRDRAPSRLFAHALAALPFLAGVAWAIANGMVEGAGGSLIVGLDTVTRNTSLLTLLIALGPALLPAVAGGIIGARRFHLAPATSLLTVAATTLFVLHLTVEGVWIGWRAGQLVQIALVPLVAACIAVFIECRRQWLASLVVALVLATGLPTTVIDLFNAQDVGNLAHGPGFTWTLRVPPDSLQALAWIREHTRARAIVQMSIGPRERDTWTLVPSFAARRMAAGRPISLLPLTEYTTDSVRVDRMFETSDAAEACAIAYELTIEFVFVDGLDRGRLAPAALEKFGRQPGCFIEVFATGEAAVYRVR
jgi:hypothetical protein